MSFSVRRYEPKDWAGFAAVRSMVYRGGGEVREGEPLLRDDCLGYLVESEGKIVGAATVLDLTCSLEGTHLRCAGIAAVGVLQTHRRTGAGTALMAGMVPLLKEEGFGMASLYAFREPFYRRSGFEVCGCRLLLKCPSHRLPKVESDLSVRTLTVDQLDQLEPVLRANTRRYNGFSLRNEHQWWRAMGGDTPFTIFAAGDPVEAYAAVRIRTDFWEEQEIREVAWSTGNGHRAMLQLFRSLTINHQAVSWYEPPDSPTWFRYRDQGIEGTVDRPIMFRALDVAACLEALGPGTSGALSISDELIPENNRTAGTGSTPLLLTIQEFTQAVLGQPNLASIAAYRGLEWGQEECGRFPSRPVYCQDFF